MEKGFTQTSKIRVLKKLSEYGCRTEKELQKLSIDEILQIPKMSISDMKIVSELQKSTKDGTLYTYLTGGEQNGIKKV